MSEVSEQIESGMIGTKAELRESWSRMIGRIQVQAHPEDMPYLDRVGDQFNEMGREAFKLLQRHRSEEQNNLAIQKKRDNTIARKLLDW